MVLHESFMMIVQSSGSTGVVPTTVIVTQSVTANVICVIASSLQTCIRLEVCLVYNCLQVQRVLYPIQLQRHSFLCHSFWCIFLLQEEKCQYHLRQQLLHHHLLSSRRRHLQALFMRETCNLRVRVLQMKRRRIKREQQSKELKKSK